MWRALRKPLEFASTPALLQIHRRMHGRNKKAMEFIAKGWSAMQEVDRVIDYTEDNDVRLKPLLKGAKKNFELALEVDNTNTHARLWLARLHLKYRVPGACKGVGAAFLVEAADMGNPDAQYELACQLRTEGEPVHAADQAFYYLEKAVDQLQPDALFLLGAVYLAGDCVKRDLESAAWCFHKAAQKGHAGAAIAYGALLLKGGITPENIAQLEGDGKYTRKASGKKHICYSKISEKRVIHHATKQFEIAAEAGNDLGFIWLNRLREKEKIEAS